MQWYDTGRSTLQYPAKTLKRRKPKAKRHNLAHTWRYLYTVQGYRQGGQEHKPDMQSLYVWKVSCFHRQEARHWTLREVRDHGREKEGREGRKWWTRTGWGSSCPWCGEPSCKAGSCASEGPSVWEEQGAKSRSTDKDCKQERAPMSKVLQTGWV